MHLENEVPIIRREMQSFHEGTAGGQTADAGFGGGDSRWLLHTSYV